MKVTFKQYIAEVYTKKFTKIEAKEVFDYLYNSKFPNNKNTFDKLYDYVMGSSILAGTSDADPGEIISEYFDEMSEQEIKNWINERTE